MKIFRAWTFKWWEVGLIKVCLLSIGLILGIYFHQYLDGLMWLWWTIFIVTAIYFLVQMFRGKM
ncbi:MAG: hypothetical protein ACD_66C00095G0002 [uncultured bacterium]|nr:MAG: hypothetical protein ACD_66C00095G0002 [uncultured bacterium]OGL95922.1 MAG: hypothetical protein A2258_00825 [Candidatus Uhrbacteria bacterium RIFOXYA2_FULL_41_8]OGL96348.1 MAG: hypothetical protein A2317_00740 [Candidatus Uhrbacteria bacterium RIFOXYB2_FULL_41_10]HAL50326.1 hypothetical protein [Candidatus Uhrbacteria bacterium]HAN06002.1 hypothetical protein [Candidatus Uhrbacteria bacterium]